MLFWKESGRRISAEERLETITQERDEERDGRIAAERARDAAVADASAMAQRLNELSAQAEQLRTGRADRRSRRRHLRRQDGDT